MTPVLVCNIAWMKRYQGIHKDDEPVGGGAYVREKRLADECYNFLPHEGRVYGFVEPPRGATIHIEHLGAGRQDDQIGGVTVAWTARHPTTGGTCVVGWYRNATVCRRRQAAPQGSQRFDPDRKKLYGFYIEAPASECKLLEPSKRLPLVPRGKGGMGQSNVWYASSLRAKRFLQDLDTLVERGPDALAKLRAKRRPSSRSWQPDVEKRARVERMAEEAAAGWYEEQEYTITRVQRENLGWDLQAEKAGSPQIQIEVKGLSGDTVLVELTPNEYRQMKRRHRTYHLCVVTRADHLGEQQLHHLRFFKREGFLRDQDNRSYDIAEIVGARVCLKQ